MTPLLLRLATAVVRLWTRIYTWRMSPALRDARRAEVESDLWESAHDPDCGGATSAFHVVVRLALGVQDDLGWRLEQESIMTRTLKVRFAFAALALGVLTLWGAVASRRPSAPPLPDSPQPLRAGIAYLPAPSPPPPPPSVPGTDIRPARPVLYGHTSYTAIDRVQPPVRIKEVRPVYPPIAVSYGLRGVVVLDAAVDERGRVIDTRIVRSIPVLDHAVVNAVRQWEFEPSVVKGVTMPATIRVAATFAAE